MSAITDATRFVRRTQLQPGEYRTNFRQIDCEIIVSLTSAEACRVTPSMSKIYLALVNAPRTYWEREGVLHFTGAEKEGNWRTAWMQLLDLLEVAGATAKKALSWMHEQGIIGYYAGKNGVGIRVFINRAASSIATANPAKQKNLRLVRASPALPHTSPAATPFKESFACLEEILDPDKNPCAPENGADHQVAANQMCLFPPEPARQAPTTPAEPVAKAETQTRPETHGSRFSPPLVETCVEEIIESVTKRLEPRLMAACSREYARTREWFEKNGLPKAVRVGQREAYDVLRRYGLVNESRSRGHAGRENRVAEPTSEPAGGRRATARPLSSEEVEQYACACVALLIEQGQSIDRTLSGMSVESGGFLLPEDARRVRECAATQVAEREGQSKHPGAPATSRT